MLPPAPNALGNFVNKPSYPETSNARYHHCKRPLGMQVMVFWFHNFLSHFWNQVIANRRIESGTEILAAYGAAYTRPLTKRIEIFKKVNKKKDAEGQKKILEKCSIRTK